jgi:hypothetical protein
MGCVMRMMASFLRERPMRMAWEIRRGDPKGFLVGTAHFFPYRFHRSLLALLEEVDTVLMEGPLDEADMEAVRVQGITADSEPPLSTFLDRRAVEKLSRELTMPSRGGGDTFSSFSEYLRVSSGDVFSAEVEGLRPWMAFFKVWSFFLMKRGWRESVDREILGLARELGKRVLFLETIEEQITALNGIPRERIVRFFNMAGSWDRFAKEHARRYLRGDSGGLVSITDAFPTRCESIVNRRDPILFERARPYLEEGRTMVCVGTIHLRGLMALLEDQGFHISPWRG